jgi:hypothetical protein
MKNAAMTQTIFHPFTGRSMTFELLADYQTTRVTTQEGKGTDFGREYAAGRLASLLRSGWKRVAA